MDSWRKSVIPATVIAAAIAAAFIAAYLPVIHRGSWTRDNQLSGAIRVERVSLGVLTLADGREIRPAGVHAAAGITSDDLDHALRVITMQGVTIGRELGDGTAMLTAEPKFYNPCGTSRWPGGYFQCPVSELLIATRYAEPDVDHAGLTARERWRLAGAVHLREYEAEPTPISDRSTALRYCGQAIVRGEYDLYVEAAWKPPPAE